MRISNVPRSAGPWYHRVQMAHPYRTPPPRNGPTRSSPERLLTASVAFGCVCVLAGCALARRDSWPFAMGAASVGAVLIARRPRLPR